MTHWFVNHVRSLCIVAAVYSYEKRAFFACTRPPPRIKGGPPEPWEESIGDTGERVGRQGRRVVEYAAKMKAMGIDERSLAGNNNPIADHVATMGQDKMRLLPGVPVALNGVAAAEGKCGKPERQGSVTTGPAT